MLGKYSNKVTTALKSGTFRLRGEIVYREMKPPRMRVSLAAGSSPSDRKGQRNELSRPLVGEILGGYAIELERSLGG